MESVTDDIHKKHTQAVIADAFSCTVNTPFKAEVLGDEVEESTSETISGDEGPIYTFEDMMRTEDIELLREQYKVLHKHRYEELQTLLSTLRHSDFLSNDIIRLESDNDRLVKGILESEANYKSASVELRLKDVSANIVAGQLQKAIKGKEEAEVKLKKETKNCNYYIIMALIQSVLVLLLSLEKIM